MDAGAGAHLNIRWRGCGKQGSRLVKSRMPGSCDGIRACRTCKFRSLPSQGGAFSSSSSPATIAASLCATTQSANSRSCFRSHFPCLSLSNYPSSPPPTTSSFEWDDCNANSRQTTTMETTAGSSHPAAMPVTHAHDGVLRYVARP